MSIDGIRIEIIMFLQTTLPRALLRCIMFLLIRKLNKLAWSMDNFWQNTYFFFSVVNKLSQRGNPDSGSIFCTICARKNEVTDAITYIYEVSRPFKSILFHSLTTCNFITELLSIELRVRFTKFTLDCSHPVSLCFLSAVLWRDIQFVPTGFPESISRH